MSNGAFIIIDDYNNTSYDSLIKPSTLKLVINWMIIGIFRRGCCEKNFRALYNVKLVKSSLSGLSWLEKCFKRSQNTAKFTICKFQDAILEYKTTITKKSIKSYANSVEIFSPLKIQLVTPFVWSLSDWSPKLFVSGYQNSRLYIVLQPPSHPIWFTWDRCLRR